ncbi:hypothetical protein [Modestobacter marinus]|uniref:Uncharacterized protein n=1 Tax=Modestobacter marinus TaxID=477641 RepID=A0A846LMC3_9ACTN|nr:hypothetical protein [Modestobacter marinus]NIH68617.1 hypothetical protein [Modestobacter marinus]
MARLGGHPAGDAARRPLPAPRRGVVLAAGIAVAGLLVLGGLLLR